MVSLEGLRDRVNVVDFSPNLEGGEAGAPEAADWCPSSSNQVENKLNPALPFCSIQALSRLDDVHPCWANLFQKHSHRYSQNNV